MRFAEFTAAVEAAESHWQSRRWGEALDGYRELVRRRLAEVGRADALAEADLIALQRLADLAVPLGETAAVDEILAALVQLYRQRGLAWCADLGAVKRLHLALEVDLHAARDALQGLVPSLGPIEEIDLSPVGLTQWEARRAWPAVQRAILFTQVYLGLGKFLVGLGQYREARVLLDRGLFHAGAGSPPLAQNAALPLRLARVGAWLEQGELTTAAAELESLAAVDAREHPGSAVRHSELLAKLHLLRGELGAAVEHLERSVEICQQSGFRRASLAALANLAQVRILLNQTGEAERLLGVVLEGARIDSDVALVRRGALLGQLARTRGGSLLGDEPVPSVAELQQGASPAPGTAPVERVLPAGPPAGRSCSCLAAFEDRALELQIELAGWNLDRAEDLLAALEGVFGATDSDLIQLRLRVLGALALYYRGRNAAQPEDRQRLLESAESLLLQVQPAFRQRGLRPDLYQLQRCLGWCLRHLERPPAQRDTLTSENQQLLEEIAGSLAAEERASYLVNKWRAGEEALALEIGQFLRLRERAAEVGFFRRLALKWRILRQLGSLLHRVYRDREALAWEAVAGRQETRRPGRFSLGRHLLLHSPRRATLVFLVLPDRVFAARLSWMACDFAVVPLRRTQVRDLVRSWHEAALGVNPSALGRVARHLDEQLGIGRLLQTLPGRVRSLTVVPDDALHGFPFAALPWQDGYLVERFAVSISHQLTPRKLRRPNETRRRALVVGIDLPIGQLPGLPGTGRQLRRLIEWLDRRGIPTAPVQNQAASRSFLLEQLPRAGLCHLSCHGVFHPDDPDSTGLVLLPQADTEQLLSLRDLSGLRLDGVRQVVLVSCWAADNFVLPGRWIVSLPEILWRRGAASVMGCLWEVEDEAASRFLRRFYRALEGLPRDQALRHAQRRALRDPRTADPLLWAGYQLYGDPGKLVL